MKRAKATLQPEKARMKAETVPVKQRLWNAFPVLCILAVAAVLRFYGLRWGLPNDTHGYSYHPDEFLTVLFTYVNVIQNGSLDPKFYNYPSLYLYFIAAAMFLALGIVPSFDVSALYLSARIVTALMGVGSVLAVYWAAEKLTGRTGALVAAAILCVAPLHVQHSHFATVDVPCTLFVALALGFAAKALKEDEWRWYLLGGAMCGLAAGTKYNAGLVLLALVAAHFLGRGKAGLRVGSLAKLIAAIAVTIAAFVVTTPSVFLNSSGVMTALKYEAVHTSTGHGLVFAGTGNGFIYTFTHSLWYGLGPCFAALFLASLVWAIVRRNKAMLCVLAFLIPYFALISLSQVRFARYTLPMFPAVAMICGWFAAEIWGMLKSRTIRLRVMVGTAAALLLLGTLGYTLALDRLFGLPDPRDSASAWIKANIPAGSSIGVIDYPWFYSPPLSKMFGFGTLPDRQKQVNETPYKITALAKEGTPATPPDFAVVTDYETQDALRLTSTGGLLIPYIIDTNTSGGREIASVISALSLVRRSFSKTTEFKDSLRCCGISFGSTKSLPHDMRYVSPTITIYRRK